MRPSAAKFAAELKILQRRIFNCFYYIKNSLRKLHLAVRQMQFFGVGSRALSLPGDAIPARDAIPGPPLSKRRAKTFALSGPAGLSFSREEKNFLGGFSLRFCKFLVKPCGERVCPFLPLSRGGERALTGGLTNGGEYYILVFVTQSATIYCG